MKVKYITTPKGIEKIIKTLKCKNSHGYDRIPRESLKVSTPFITSPLTYIGNKSLSSGVFPYCLKFSEIKPLHKKGDRMDITNFRPIPLLTFHSFWKKLYIQDCPNTLIKISYFSIDNAHLMYNAHPKLF
jgi:hypothetical protein